MLKWPFQGLLVTSNDRESKGVGLNHLVSPESRGLLEFFVLVIFSPSSHIHQSQTEEGVEDGGALSHTFLADSVLSTYSCCWWFRNPVVTGWYGKFQYYLQGPVHPSIPMFGFQGLLKANLQGFLTTPEHEPIYSEKGTFQKKSI